MNDIMAIKPRTDRKPGGASRFAEMLNPGKAMAAAAMDSGSQEPENNRVVTIENRRLEKDKFKNGQPLRIDKGLWLRLKSLQLKREIEGRRTTLMELANEALEVFLTAQGE